MKFVASAFTVLALALTLGSVAHAHGDHKMVCKKDGKVIKAKGKTEAEKKAKCEEKGGKWEQGEDDHESDHSK